MRIGSVSASAMNPPRARTHGAEIARTIVAKIRMRRRASGHAFPFSIRESATRLIPTCAAKTFAWFAAGCPLFRSAPG